MVRALGSMVVHGYLTYNIQETAPPWDPTVVLCQGSVGGHRGVGVFSCAIHPCDAVSAARLREYFNELFQPGQALPGEHHLWVSRL
jgi:hypothetical protein